MVDFTIKVKVCAYQFMIIFRDRFVHIADNGGTKAKFRKHKHSKD